MIRIFAKRRGRAWSNIELLLVVLCSWTWITEVDSKEWTQCLKKSSISQTFRPNKQILDITLEVSPRITHQLSTHIFRILLQEKLGYSRVKIVEYKDYDTDVLLDRMNCIKEVKGSFDDILPQSIINLDVPMPLNYLQKASLDNCIKDLGTMLPSGRFGWFVPKDLTQPIQKFDSKWSGEQFSWTYFMNTKFASAFEIDDAYKRMLDATAINGTTNSYFCNDSRCENGWYVPKKCKGSARCAVLLAPDFESTKSVIGHIEDMNIYVKVLWLGDNLKKASDDLLEKYKTKNVPKSFMIMSYTPSEVIFNPGDYVTVTMQRCEFANETQYNSCFYEKRRSVKIAWKVIEKSAPNAYDILKEMNFLDRDLHSSLINLYNKRMGNSTVPEIACEWLRQNENIVNLWVPKVEQTIYVGGIFPIHGSTYTGKGIVKGALMAVEAINANTSVLPNYKFELLVGNGECRADKVMKTFIDYITTVYDKLVGVLGPACSETVEPLQGVSKYYKTMLISYSAEGSFFSDSDKYPYFFRTIGENKHYQHVYLDLLKSLGWKRVAALTEDGQKYTEYISHMQDMLEGNGVTFISNTKFPRDRDRDAMNRYLQDLQRKRARIIIADVFGQVARHVMCEASKLRMTAKEGYVWFLPTWLNNTWYDTTYFNQHNNESVNCTTATMIEAINGYFAITHAYFSDDNDLMQENITVGAWREKYRHAAGLDQSSYAGYAYDGVWTYALALDTLLKTNPEATTDLHSVNVTNKLTQIIKDIDFNGVSGRIKFRGGSTRFSMINILQWYNNQSRLIGRYFPNISESSPDILGGRLELNKSAIVWLSKTKPDDGTEYPEICKWQFVSNFFNVSCDNAIIIFFVSLMIILVILLGSVIVVLVKTYENRFDKTTKYMESLGLQHLLVQGADYTGLDKWEIEREMIVLNRKLGEGAFGTVYGGEARLSDNNLWTPVAVKTLKVGSKTEEKLDFLSEAEVMKRFDHKNIVKLIGVCTKVEPVYTIMEFMLYGDLKNYLLARRHLVNGNNVDESDEVSSKKLTSMALDVARGLSYLAELKYVHRDVASRNCLLNEQRVVKLGDFGLTRPMFENDYYKFNRRGMMPVRWMSPESLESGMFTPKSDVWSYGVLLFEIITFGSFPFQALSNAEVLDYVKAGNTLSIPQGVKSQLEILLKTCWMIDPKKRPAASEIVEYLANNSRLISPCLDVPLASVQTEDTGQLDMQLPDQFRKCSSSISFKVPNGLTTLSTPTKVFVNGDKAPSVQSDVACPEECLLIERSDSISGGSKYTRLNST
ncbi:PREDICTED: uncharacterized protein LOC108560102 isoform X2 [Nicrophorus vespilloides]|uniref:Uncharacterized protein LOC108560102 isoform X2 n=1 Tax=Nicrophorus vespilloides TaxID=110193 RepID=A0ABM1MEP0_NICVS|nr:PREDICTED: uncharacterized protein LOC108560102 isoform X2 [Nicrophorus vespilloides]